MNIARLPPFLRKAVFVVVTGLIVTIVGGLIVVLLTRPSPSGTEDAQSAPDPTVTESTVGTSASRPPTPTVASPTPNPSSKSPAAVTRTAAGAPVPVRQPLVLADAVDREWCKVPGNTGSRWRSMALPLNGTSYENGLTCQPWRAGQQGWLDFMRPGWATTLHVVAGGSDEGASTSGDIRVVVEDAFTSEVLDEAIARIGSHAELSVSTTALRVRVRLVLVDDADRHRMPTIGFAGEWQG